MGFTAVRLPFSNEMLTVREVPPGAIDYALNPELRDKTPLQVGSSHVFPIVGHECEKKRCLLAFTVSHEAHLNMLSFPSLYYKCCRCTIALSTAWELPKLRSFSTTTLR